MKDVAEERGRRELLLPRGLARESAEAAGQGELPVGVGQANPGLPASTLFMPDGIPMDLEVRPSPPTAPFALELPLPPIAIPVRGNDGQLASGHENLTDPYGAPAPKDMLAPTPGFSAGRIDTRDHQRFAEFLPHKYYQVNIGQIRHDYHPDLTARTPGAQGSISFAYAGVLPGPTFVTFYNEPLLVRMANALPDCNSPADFPPFGIQSTTTHLHNAHTPSESDGFPMDYVDPGQWHDHHYVMHAAGADWRERMSSLWYHDHRMDFTAPNVYAGLTGFFLCFDKLTDSSIPDAFKDTGEESDLGTLQLPGRFVFAANGDVIAREYDIPLMLHDVLFDDSGEAVFDVFNTDGILGDKFTVNRTVQPRLAVERRRYRFRVQNGGPSRFYELYLTDAGGALIPGVQFYVVSSDGNILHKPIPQDSLKISVAERHDVVIDFGAVPGGVSEVYLYNSLEQVHGRGPSGRQLHELDPDVNRDALMRFDLQAASGADLSRDLSGVTQLRTMPDATLDLQRLSYLITTSKPSDFTEETSEVPNAQGGITVVTRRYLQWLDGSGTPQNVYFREFNFDYDGGLWTINNMVADMTEIPIVIEPGAIEVWRIKNDGGDWSHPVHIHFEEFRLIEFNGKPISIDDPRYGRKDVLTIGPNDRGLCFFRFRDFEGHYIMHCHNVIHEDHAMMLRWNIGLTRDVGHHEAGNSHRYCNGVFIPQPTPQPYCE